MISVNNTKDTATTGHLVDSSVCREMTGSSAGKWRGSGCGWTMDKAEAKNPAVRLTSEERQR